MRLIELLRAAGLVDQPGVDRVARDLEVGGIACDSGRVRPGDLFCALPGHRTHGAAFAQSARAAGAVAVMTDAAGARDLGGLLESGGVPLVVVADPRSAMARLSVAFYGAPSADMTMLGVTGTNGKTSVSHLVQAAMLAAGRSCGVIGTLGASLPGWQPQEHPRTTPEAPDLQRLLAQMRADGAQAVSMEVSSIAVREHRVDGIAFDAMGFTGLSHDHLDYHKTMEAYFAAKAELFTAGRAGTGVVVIDDAWGERLTGLATVPVQTVTTHPGVEADWRLRRAGAHVLIEGMDSARFPLPIATDFAIANAGLAIAMAYSQGVPAQLAADAIASARVPGRMELVAAVDGIDFIVDYAHSPDAIERVVDAAVREREGTGARVIVVIGAGGDRDRQKRPAMGRAASEADVVVVTDDNPRGEDPASIRTMVVRGVDRGTALVQEIEPREKAIEFAVQEARSGDAVLVLGKGHERTQEFADRVVAFDDREILASFVQQRFGSVGGDRGVDG